MKPIKRTMIGMSALGAISLVRAAYPHLPVQLSDALTGHHPSGQDQLSQTTPDFGNQIVAEVIQAVTGSVDTASAATPCDPRDNTPNRSTYCIVATPVPQVTPKPTTAATPKPIATSAPQASSKSAPGKPSFQASSTNIQTGNSVTLSWLSNGATSCTLSPGSITVSGTSGSYVTGKLTSATTFNLTCRNSYGSASANAVTVKVSAAGTTSDGPAAIVTFVATPPSIDSGQYSTLSWIATGIPHGGCNLNPSPLNQTDPSGNWITPYLLGSKSYTLTCRSTAGDVVYANASVTVNGITPADAPAPSVGSSGDNQAKTFTTDIGQIVMNGAVVSSVSGLVTLDPTLFTDSARASQVASVKFYEDTKLLQAVTVPPFALDTTKLSNGKHPITQRTYYRDDSISEVTRILSINNTAAVSNAQPLSPVLAIVLIILVLVGTGVAVWFWLRGQSTKTPPSAGPTSPSQNSGYRDSIDSSLLK